MDHDNHLLHGVVIHKIPVAAILSVFLVQSKLSKPKVFIFLALFAAMTPLGNKLKNNIPEIGQYADEINGVVIGIFFMYLLRSYLNPLKIIPSMLLNWEL